MPFIIVRNDITKMQVDAVVNAANKSLLGGGGVDGAIHRAAGAGLLMECIRLHGCKTGEAKLTGGHKMPCRYIIHTVGPVWHGGSENEPELLYSCYANSLRLAAEKDCKSVAFPLISAGIYGYPKEQALEIAHRAITDFLTEHDEMEVYLAVLDKKMVELGSGIADRVKEYIDDHYVEQLESEEARPRLKRTQTFSAPTCAPAAFYGELLEESPCSLEERLSNTDEGFSAALLRLIDERGMKDSEVYKKANIDRKLFSKIRCDAAYRPKKQTVLAFALALELTLPETEQLLKKAGYSLSDSINFDVIVKFFIESRIYDIFTVNQALFEYDQTLIGI